MLSWCVLRLTLVVDIGLSMSKRHSLNDKLYNHPSLSPEEWADYRRAWRSLMFLSRQASP